MKRILLMSLVIMVFGIFNAWADDLTMVYVDLNQAINESNNGKNATKILEDMVNVKQKIIAGKEAELNKLKEEIAKQSSVLTPESLRDKQDSLNKLNRDLQIMAQDFQNELQRKEQELTMEIFNEITEIVARIGKEEGYTIIFEKREGGIIYSSKKLDITEEVIKQYDDATKEKE